MLVPASLWAQLSRYDGVVLPSGTPNGPANVAVCQAGGSGGPPCSPLAIVYSDQNGRGQISQPFNADMNGHFYFYATAGTYVLDTYGTGYATTLTTITVSGTSGSLGGGTQCLTSQMQGSDIGAKVSACFGAAGPLSGIPGTIRVDQGGTWSTQVTVPSGINIIVDAKAGTITNGMASRTPILLMNSNTSLYCDSWLSTIGTPTAGDETTVCGVDQGSGCSSATQVISNVTVNGCHFVTQGSPGSPLDGVVWLENCIHCHTDNNFFDGIKNIDVVIGANSSTGNRSQYYSVKGNTFRGYSNTAVAVINGQHFEIGQNFFHFHGPGAAGDIDIEPNGATDYSEDGDIHDNIIDATDAQANNVDYGITLQNGSFTHGQFMKIHDNLLWGGEAGAAVGKLQQGITTEGNASGSFNTVYNNTITNSNEGLGLGGAYDIIHDNYLICNTIAVGPSVPATNNLIEHNTISSQGCGLSGGGLQANLTITESNATASANNVYRDNFGNVSYSIPAGHNGQVINDLQIDGSADTFRNPVGLSGGVVGSISGVQLAAPSNVNKGGTAGTCNGGFTANTYFYKVTALDSLSHESSASTEASWAAGGGNGCFNVQWNKVPGAQCYNVYRSTTTNTEQLVTASPVCGGVTLYGDIGGQTPGAAAPSTNATGGVGLASTTFAALPSAASSAGQMFLITDSTNVAAEGQNCAGSSTNKAIAMSNGTAWKCF